MGQLPPSAVLSTGLKKSHTIAAIPGRLTDLWGGDLHGDHVVLKGFRMYTAENLNDTEEVSMWLA
jgi:hypothetical protein